MRVKSITAPRSLGFDCAGYPNARARKVLYDAGYRIAIRYIRRDKHVNDKPDLSGWLTSLSKQEQEELLQSSFCLSLVQIGAWRTSPNSQRGERAGEAAGYNASTLGAPSKTTVWLDAEWDDGIVRSRSDVIDYVNAWATAVDSYGYEPGIYVGPGISLGSSDLFKRLWLKRYWGSASLVPAPANRGFCMRQGLPVKVDITSPIKPIGRRKYLEIDQDLVFFDNFNQRFKVYKRV